MEGGEGGGGVGGGAGGGGVRCEGASEAPGVREANAMPNLLAGLARARFARPRGFAPRCPAALTCFRAPKSGSAPTGRSVVPELHRNGWEGAKP